MELLPFEKKKYEKYYKIYSIYKDFIKAVGKLIGICLTLTYFIKEVPPIKRFSNITNCVSNIFPNGRKYLYSIYYFFLHVVNPSLDTLLHSSQLKTLPFKTSTSLIR